MRRTLPFVRVINGLIEYGWLFLIIAVPTFFNVKDERSFEPDKIVLMRNVTLVMVVLVALKVLYLAPSLLSQRAAARTAGQAPAVESPQGTPAGRVAALVRRWPVVATFCLFMVVYLLATVHSIIPSISFWGSYDRLEGYYTYLTYFALSVLFVTHLRTRAQLDRLVTAIIVSSVPPAVYSWIQHFNLDPLVWGTGSETAVRTSSTLGNPIFLSAFLLMTTPFTLHRLVERLRPVLERGGRDVGGLTYFWQLLGLLGYAVALLLQATGILFSASRGPMLGYLAALVVFGLSLAVHLRLRWLLRASVGFALLLVLLFGVTNTVLRSSSLPTGGPTRLLYLLPSESGSSEVRSLLWKSSLLLAKAHPVLGCGPEVLLFCWYPDYPADLRKVESANAAPDRSHDEEIDVLLMAGVLGEAAYLLVLGTTITTLVVLLRRSKDFWSASLASALLATYLGHIVEGATGIAMSATLLLFWMTSAVAAVLRGAPRDSVAALYTSGTTAEEPLLPAEVATPRPVTATTNRGQKRHSRQQESRSRTPQRPAARSPRYSFFSALDQLSLGSQIAVALLTLVFLGVLAGSVALFSNNVQQILADVQYRDGQNYEATAVSYTSAGVAAQATAGSTALSEYQQGLALFQTAIYHYQQAVNMESQDTYYLFLGKTLLEYADAMNRDPSHAASRTEVVNEIKAALAVFQHAERDNPLNPDHPRNIAKLYDYWGLQAFGLPADLSKLALGDQAFAKAASLAPHNPDIYDEWAVLDIQIGSSDAARARTWYSRALAHLKVSVSLYPENGVYYRDLGTVYQQFGQWAEAARQMPEARHYYQLAADDWTKAVGAVPGYTLSTDYPSIYPRLATLYASKLDQICPAGQFAIYSLNAIKQHQLSAADSTPVIVQALNLAVAQARADKACHLSAQ